MINPIADADYHPNDLMLKWHRTHIAELENLHRLYAHQGKSIEKLSSQEMDDYHLRAINLTLRHVWANNAYYREALEQSGMTEPHISSLEQWSSVPYLHKDRLRGNKHLLLSVPPSEICQYHLTSGTTGKPIYTAHTLADQYYHDAIPSYAGLFEGDSADDVVGIALPYEFAQPALGFHRLYQFIYGAAVLSLGKGGYMAPIDKSIEAMQEFDVSILVTTPSYAAFLAEETVKLGLTVQGDLKVRKLMLTGEGCSPQFTKRLEEIWGCEIHQIYGSTECGLVGIQLPGTQGYYLLEGSVLIEIVDPATGKPKAYGEVGEVVTTTLLKEAMPFIRYRTGDLGFLEEPDDTSPIRLRKLHLRGRMGSTVTIEGIDYSPIVLEHFLLMVPEVGLWYRFLIEDEMLTVEIEPTGEALADEELTEKVRQHMYSAAGVSCEVRINRSIPRQYSKAQRVFFI